ncbi:hypothetical protein MICCA_30009 [Microcystis aeruginosa PCC 9432]|jgi:hypothetical protein|uniref:Uncharacterized protein n=1 Tax=Microcystis aeruginosa PCC 9432 TaxID=1160280 RepID=A0A822L9Y9_MICAE|nr:hypothetical protein [Microcystis aeruginosa]TRU01871.1 MAG: hypothetical protein EWV62_01120 [Microcystis aeruginosa Ma_OC_LR_19540900_S633]TYT69625.1 hypothetical protein FXO09_19815 [Microcystis aeruginosa KLA2]CCH93360.1 hypothetical protein MICCA_30009 [Microcystis aeruginosa PCC 9432]
MKILEIVNKKRQPIGRIFWELPDKITLEVLDSRFESKLQSLIETGKRDGFPYRKGREVEDSGHRIFIDEKIIVKPEDEKFLEAMADVVSRYTFGGERAFGLLKEQ